MNNIKNFNHEQFGNLRTVTMPDGQIGFVGKDVAIALGYSNASKAIMVHVDCDDKVKIMMDQADSQNGNVLGKTQTTIINESGLYSLVLSSKLPTARKFKHWVTAEVLPAIRQTGAYMTPHTIMQVMQQPETILSICQKLVELDEENKRLWPKAEYAEQVLLSPTCYTMTQVAKSLSMTVQELQHCLHDMGIIYRSPSGPWMLYAPYLKQGYEAYRTKTGENIYGDVLWTDTYLVWTERGKEFITRLLSPIGRAA